jgi:hypothetical protein
VGVSVGIGVGAGVSVGTGVGAGVSVGTGVGGSTVLVGSTCTATVGEGGTAVGVDSLKTEHEKLVRITRITRKVVNRRSCFIINLREMF